jgi:hypothetical protein
VPKLEVPRPPPSMPKSRKSYRRGDGVVMFEIRRHESVEEGIAERMCLFT